MSVESYRARRRRYGAQDRARHHEQSPRATAAVMAEARALLPGIVEQFGDTPLVQARRLAMLEAEVARQDPRRKLVAA